MGRTLLRGAGECRTPGGVYALAPGMGWRIPAGRKHSSFTTGASLGVIAWHPDFGPTHDDHLMINLTLFPALPTGEIIAGAVRRLGAGG